MSRASERVVAAIRAESPGGYTEGADPVSAMLDKDIEHSRPLGGRDAFSRMALSLVEQAGDEIRAGLAEPEFVRDYVTAIKSGVKVRDRTCLNLAARILKLIDAEKTVLIQMWSNLGVKDEHEARKKIELAQSVEGVSPHDGADTCVEYLKAYLTLHPGRRHGIVKQLGGVTEVLSSDYRVVDTNKEAV